MDVVRVNSNQAALELHLDASAELVDNLFKLVNIVGEHLITQPRTIDTSSTHCTRTDALHENEGQGHGRPRRDGNRSAVGRGKLRNPTPAEAVASLLTFERDQNLTLPRIYVSTSITSGGHRRDPELEDPAMIPEAVARNNRTAGLIMEALASGNPDFIDRRNVMVPTELGKVPSWHDTDYLQFYFGWLGGLSETGAIWYTAQLADDAYREILAGANDRKADNVARWPAYKIFSEIAIAKLEQALARHGNRRNEGSTLLQLADVDQSLGCRAETMFAEIRQLDVVTVSFAEAVRGDLADDLDTLQHIGASVGRRRSTAELVPLLLRR